MLALPVAGLSTLEALKTLVDVSLVTLVWRATRWATKVESDARAFGDKLMNNHLSHIQDATTGSREELTEMRINYEKQNAEIIRALDDVRDEIRRRK